MEAYINCIAYHDFIREADNRFRSISNQSVCQAFMLKAVAGQQKNQIIRKIDRVLLKEISGNTHKVLLLLCISADDLVRKAFIFIGCVPYIFFPVKGFPRKEIGLYKWTIASMPVPENHRIGRQFSDCVQCYLTCCVLILKCAVFQAFSQCSDLFSNRSPAVMRIIYDIRSGLINPELQ